MKIDTSFLRTRVARRIVGLFFLCALLPSTALAIVAFAYVTNQLESTGNERRKEIGGRTNQAVLERLTSLHTHLAIIASGVDGGADGSRAVGIDTTVNRRFTAISVQFQDRAPVLLLGSHHPLPDLDGGQRQRLSSGDAVLLTQADSAGTLGARILTSLALDATDLAKGVLWAEIDPEYLMTGGEPLPDDTGGGEKQLVYSRYLSFMPPQLNGSTDTGPQPTPSAPTSPQPVAPGGAQGELLRTVKSPLSGSQKRGSAEKLLSVLA